MNNYMSNNFSMEKNCIQPTITFTQPRSHSPLENTYESFNEYTTENNCTQYPTSFNENMSNLMSFHNQYDSGYSQNNSLINSPFLTSIHNTLQNRALNKIKKNIQFQSTPNKSFINNDQITSANKNKTASNYNKNKVNFHSITDLATSALSDESRLSDESKIHSSVLHSSANSFNINQSDELLNFNEKLKMMSQWMTNKENSNDLITRTKRKPRTQINKQQREILEYAYKMKSYPDSSEIEYLCTLLGFEENVIRVS